MTRIPIVTFSTGDDSAVEIDSGLFEAAERALLEEQQARDPAAEARTKQDPPAPMAVRVWRLGGLAGGFFR